ncbi:MAG TPA: hypothetical protein VHN80_15515 [Kineosporiaceae bacterium]|nr:hypothetical protein [Kineosporiaceae bacterium]
MSRRALITAAIPIALLAVNPPSCSAFGSNTTTTTKTEKSGTTIVIKADRGVCWKASIDDARYSGCGDRTFTSASRKHATTVWKTDGDGTVTVRCVTNGKTIDEGSVQVSDHYVVVEQRVNVSQH